MRVFSNASSKRVVQVVDVRQIRKLADDGLNQLKLAIGPPMFPVAAL